MGFRFFGTPTSPIAIDFGTASVKVLQTDLGDRPNLIAAAELPKPISDDGNVEQEDFHYLESELSRLLRKGGFKGRRVVFTVPSSRTMVQHLQIGNMEGVKREEAIKSQLQMQLNLSLHNTVIRWIDVAEVIRDGSTKTELICFAIPRDVVMGYVGLLEKMRMQVLDVRTEAQSIVHAFDHIHRRAGDENLTTMYIDLGWGNTRVAMAHGKAITFARSIPLGGLHFDKLIAKQLGCDLISAKGHRLALQSPMPARPASTSTSAQSANRSATATAHHSSGDDADSSARSERAAGQSADEGSGFARLAAAMAKERAAEATRRDERRTGRSPAVLPQPVEADDSTPDANPSAINGRIDLTEVMDTITDELSMCHRYHRGLFPNRQIDRVILLGGEARQPWLCRHIVRALRVPARLGDPLARFTRDDNTMECIGLAENHAQPGWAAVSGLCTTSTD